MASVELFGEEEDFVDHRLGQEDVHPSARVERPALQQDETLSLVQKAALRDLQKKRNKRASMSEKYCTVMTMICFLFCLFCFVFVFFLICFDATLP